jgi:hypothetical protein
MVTSPSSASARATGTGTRNSISTGTPTRPPKGQAVRSSSAVIAATFTSMSVGVPGTRYGQRRALQLACVANCHSA